MLHLKRDLSQSMIHNASLCTVSVSLSYMMTTKINEDWRLFYVLFSGFVCIVGLINLPLVIAKGFNLEFLKQPKSCHVQLQNKALKVREHKGDNCTDPCCSKSHNMQVYYLKLIEVVHPLSWCNFEWWLQQIGQCKQHHWSLITKWRFLFSPGCWFVSSAGILACHWLYRQLTTSRGRVCVCVCVCVFVCIGIQDTSSNPHSAPLTVLWAVMKF